MVANFIWLYACGTLPILPFANYRSLIEMWLGILCTCLLSLHNFIRAHFKSKKESVGQVAFPAVRDPNSDRLAQPQASVPDSGYYSGQFSNVSLETLDVERQIPMTPGEPGVRPAASNKSLLTSVARCDD